MAIAEVAQKQSSRHVPNLHPGDVVAGRFRIVETIGSGGFSVVYRAHQEQLNRFVALKVLKPKASSDQKIVERFRREALFASQLTHPNTITLFDYGQTEDGLCYIAMEHLEGHDLSEVVKWGDPVDPARVWSILVQSCRSLAEAHDMGLIHRDLKPENIFLCKREKGEQVKVLDFGVSKALSHFGSAGGSGLAPLTQEGTVFGTPLYMAPEQARAEEITAAADVYALGHMAYEMITGRAAYADEISPMDVMLRQVNDPPLVLPEGFEDSPFGTLIYESTIKEPGDRIRDAGEFLSVLMSHDFAPYQEQSEAALYGPRHRVAGPGELADLMMTSEAASEEDKESNRSGYDEELQELTRLLSRVKELQQVRLAVIRGRAGVGRSNLLRAFLKGHIDEPDIHIIHRRSHGKNSGNSELMESMSTPPPGILEVEQVVDELLSESDEPRAMQWGRPDGDKEGDPLRDLVSRRDAIFARLMAPFRRATSLGTLIWAVENVENAQPMTLALIERLIRELRLRPASILVAVTVDPEALMGQPGLVRYVESLLEAPQSYAHHLHVLSPAEARDERGPKSSARRLALDSDIGVEGSYHGIIPSLPEDMEIDDEMARWAAMADGEPEAEQEEAEERQASQPTQRLELFTTDGLELSESSDEEANAGVLEAFDSVMGYLAQLDERVIPRALWQFVYPRLLPIEETRLMSAILEYAERFGIVLLSPTEIRFTNREYTKSLRRAFEERDDAVEAHARLADILLEYDPNPERRHRQRIIHHAVKGEAFERAIELCLEAGDAAYDRFDLDLAREYYLKFQSIVEEMSTRKASRPSGSHGRAWLRLGEIQATLGEFGSAEDALHRAIEEGTKKEIEVRASAHHLLGELAFAQERYEVAQHWFEGARDLYRQTSSVRAYISSLGEMGRCCIMRGKPRRAEGILLEAIDKAGRLGETVLEARMRRYMGQVLTRQARFMEAVEYLEESRSLLDPTHQSHEVVDGLCELGDAHFAEGRYEQARQRFEQAQQVAEEQRVESDIGPPLGLAKALAALGRAKEAELHLVDAMSRYGSLSQPVERARVQLHLGDLYLATGRQMLAAEHYEHVVELGRRVGHRHLLFNAMIRLGYAQFDQGSVGEALEMVHQAAEVARESEDKERDICARAHLIYLQLVGQGFEVADGAFVSLLTETEDDDFQAAQVICDLFRADAAMATGELLKAKTLLSRLELQAASIGEFGLMIPIARRQAALMDRQSGQSSTADRGIEGIGLGALIPPEVGRRRLGVEQ